MRPLSLSPSSRSRVQPLSSTTFLRALLETFPPPSQIAHRGPATQKWHRSLLPRSQRLGLAISGGVDSMALAVLCNALARERPELRLRFHAFVVDHKLREGSTTEAARVKEVLTEELGLTTSILPLTWPEHTSTPSELSGNGLESRARALRFQALGLACRAQRITSLLMAHHADDQAETVLMRLANEHRGVGLQGMRGVAGIPECAGIHGVNRSGGLKRDVDGEEKIQSDGTSRHGLRDKGRTKGIQIETSGIQIHRPLLPFDKARLIATCETADMPWFEDTTNTDATLTSRNTIRQLLAQKRLPIALRPPSLLAMATRIQQRTAEMTSRVERWFERCETLRLDTRSGVVVVNFPTSVQELMEISGGVGDAGQYHRKSLAALLLRRVVELVSPYEVVSLSKIQQAVHALFPDLEAEQNGPNRRSDTSTVTVAGVMFERLGETVVRREREAQTYTKPRNLWALSRQPYAQLSGVNPVTVFPGAPQSALEVTEPLDSERPCPPSVGWSQWHLWDGRFWIRIRNGNPESVVVRPMQRWDLKPFRAVLNADDQKRFGTALVSAAPAKARWTLPVIALQDSEGAPAPLAFPSLGVKRTHKQARAVEWMIRYKNVDLGRRKKGDILLARQDRRK